MTSHKAAGHRCMQSKIYSKRSTLNKVLCNYEKMLHGHQPRSWDRSVESV